MTDFTETPQGDALRDEPVRGDVTGVRPLTGPIDLSEIDLEDIEGRREVREHLTRFLMPYKFAIDEVVTKLRILQEEFSQTGEYNPIEHVSSRLKDIESIITKMERRGIPLQSELIRESITDIAGVRVVCSFVSDVYRVFELLTAQSDVKIYQVKDYIAKPKENGYRSLHLLLELPVFLSSGPVPTIVEVQIRTIAMDFWASLEHKIYYKYDREVPETLLSGLHDAASQASQLDTTMEWLHIAIRGSDRESLIRRGTDTVTRSLAAGRGDPSDADPSDADPSGDDTAELGGADAATA